MSMITVTSTVGIAARYVASVSAAKAIVRASFLPCAAPLPLLARLQDDFAICAACCSAPPR